METKFKEGDIVCLKTEPTIKLTVTRLLRKDNEIVVAFFNEGKFQSLSGHVNSFDLFQEPNKESK